MLLKSCFRCEFHEAKKNGKQEISYCQRENCWSRYSKCVANKALNRFLEQESADQGRPFTVIDQICPGE